MSFYVASITQQGNDFSQTFMADTKSLLVHFRWDTVTEEQWDIMDRGVRNLRDSDPLINDEGDIIKDYDYLKWYDEWNEEAAYYPQSLRNLSEGLRIAYLTDKQTEVRLLKKIYDELTARLAWYVDITVDDAFYSGVLRPKGWICANDDSWKLSFRTKLEKVGKEDLDKVTVAVEI